MHELLHVAVLVFTLCGAASILLVVLWPLIAEKPLPGATMTVMGALIALAAAALVLEWVLVH
ncbi:MAG: hypothetical protein ACLGIB_03780 [Actinomycetota bacterium]